MTTTTAPPLRILLLEDNDDDASLILRELHKEGLVFDVRRVQTERDYRLELQEFAPTLILADYILPAYDGLSALKVAREVCPAIPFLIVSGILGEEKAIDALHHGAVDYVMKTRLGRLGPAARRAFQETEERQRRRQSDTAFQALAQEWQTTFDSVQSAIWFTDENRKILRHNHQAIQLFKMEALHQADGRGRGAVADGAFSRMLQSRRRETSEVALGDRWFEIVADPVLNPGGGLVGAVQIATDITERKRAERKMREQADLLDLTSDAILVRALNGAATFWNQGAERLFGWPVKEMLGRSVKETLVPAAAHGQVEEADRQTLEQGRWMGEIGCVTKTGQELIGQTRITLLRDAAGAPISFLVLITDITEQKRLEAEFLRAQRLEAIGTLAGGIAHDLNNILAPILMVVPALRDARTMEELAPGLNLIETSAGRAVGVIRQLLTFSRGLGGERITIHLKHLLSDLASLIRETFPRNLRFTSSRAPDLWPLVADPTQLHQILLNLCINARDAMPEGGTLAVTAANFQVDDLYASGVPGARPGNYVHLQVSDTGSGIRPEHLDQIFDPFFTTKAVGRGTGLGLATVQKVVAAHGGFITVRSQVGQGTTFHVYLPAQPEAVAPPEVTSPAPAQAGQGELILVADDEDDIRLITQQTLLRHGYRVVTARDGVEAIAVFVQHQEAIKAVVTDLMMPGMDGLGLVRVLTKMKPALAVVVATGVENDPDDREPNPQLAALRRLAVGRILTKPFTVDQLLQALRAVLSPCATPATAAEPPTNHHPLPIGSAHDQNART